MDGILVLAKPTGPTSHDLVALVRRLSGTRRVGHGGTLDPFASGVLPLFLGQATRVVEYHLGADKRYRATVCFGAGSTTDDLEGELTPAEGLAPDRSAVEAALEAFRGEVLQRPPPFSAIKVGGRRAYAMARAGEAPELAPRKVTIHEIAVVDWDDTDPTRPIAVLDVRCSAGTYIRAIARDLGEAVGSAAYLGALVRTASGTFRLEDAVSVDAVRAAAGQGEAAVRALLLPVDAGLDAMPSITLAPAEVDGVVRGQFVRPSGGIPPGIAADVPVRLFDEAGGLVGLGHVNAGRVAPDKVLRAVPAAEPRPAGDAATASDAAPAGDGATADEAAPAGDGATASDAAPAGDGATADEAAPAGDGATASDAAPAGDATAAGDGAPAEDGAPACDATAADAPSEQHAR